MRIEDILRHKGREVVTIAESQTVLEAVRVLVARNIGALVVTRGSRPTGMFTERDVLRLTASHPGELGTIRIGDVMTREPITAEGDSLLSEMMDVMTEHKIRHLPVVDGNRLVGIVSIGDLLNACRAAAEEENDNLREYIRGVG
jgi:CBS domain-containing protein